MHEMIDNNGIQLAISNEGDGPDLLFIHGVGSAQVLWHPIIVKLRGRYRCWNLDLRGHGASDRTPGAYTRASYASDLLAALDHIGRPTIAIGHSLGGVSIMFAGPQDPPMLRAGYALDSPPFAPLGGRSASAAIFERQVEMLRAFQPENRPVDDYEAVLAKAPYIGGGTIGEMMLPEQLRGRAESLSQLDPECLETVIAGYRDANGLDPAVPVPLRMLTADPELGASFRPEFTERLLAHTPHAEIDVLPGVGHQMFMMRGFEEPVLADMTAFIERVCGLDA